MRLNVAPVSEQLHCISDLRDHLKGRHLKIIRKKVFSFKESFKRRFVCVIQILNKSRIAVFVELRQRLAVYCMKTLGSRYALRRFNDEKRYACKRIQAG